MNSSRSLQKTLTLPITLFDNRPTPEAIAAAAGIPSAVISAPLANQLLDSQRSLYESMSTDSADNTGALEEVKKLVDQIASDQADVRRRLSCLYDVRMKLLEPIEEATLDTTEEQGDDSRSLECAWRRHDICGRLMDLSAEFNASKTLRGIEDAHDVRAATTAAKNVKVLVKKDAKARNLYGTVTDVSDGVYTVSVLKGRSSLKVGKELLRVDCDNEFRALGSGPRAEFDSTGVAVLFDDPVVMSLFLRVLLKLEGGVTGLKKGAGGVVLTVLDDVVVKLMLREFKVLDENASLLESIKDDPSRPRFARRAVEEKKAKATGQPARARTMSERVAMARELGKGVKKKIGNKLAGSELVKDLKSGDLLKFNSAA